MTVTTVMSVTTLRWRYDMTVTTSGVLLTLRPTRGLARSLEKY